MEILVDFTIPSLPPSVNSMYVRTRKGIYKDKKVKLFEKRIIKILLKRPRISDPVALLLEYHIKDPAKYAKRDLDNFLKCTIDGLQLSGQIRNDNKIALLASVKLHNTRNYIRGYICRMPEIPAGAGIIEALGLVTKSSA